MSFFYILDINPLLDVSLVNVFSHSVGCLCFVDGFPCWNVTWFWLKYHRNSEKCRCDEITEIDVFSAFCTGNWEDGTQHWSYTLNCVSLLVGKFKLPPWGSEMVLQTACQLYFKNLVIFIDIALNSHINFKRINITILNFKFMNMTYLPIYLAL